LHKLIESEITMRNLLFLLFALILTLPAPAITSDDGEPPARPGDPDYNAGLTAWEREDWPGVLENMAKVIARRPWDDDAHNLMGFAYRQVGDYDRSLQHYREALDLNPHHRGAMAYLGQTYLALGQAVPALELLNRIAVECERVGAGSACPAWQELKAAVDAHQGPAGAAIESATTSWGLTGGSVQAAAASTQLSEQEVYRVSFRSESAPIVINRIHPWVLHIETVTGQPVEQAEITVDGGMPEHDHGLPTAPRMTGYLGHGDYRVEGMKFHMNGRWEVAFTITDGAQTDRVVFDLEL
jgi:hypothetical protein